MNMLIAIMGDTFSIVQQSKEESGLREQVQLISDHAQLLDLKKLFHGKKYIIRIFPGGSDGLDDDYVVDQVKDSGIIINNQIKKMEALMLKKIDHIDTNTRHLLKHQFEAIGKVQKKLGVIHKSVK